MDQNCHANVFLLSCNIMDRFLSQLGIKKSQFQVTLGNIKRQKSKMMNGCILTPFPSVGSGCDDVHSFKAGRPVSHHRD